MNVKLINAFEECIHDMEAGVTNFCKDGECVGCGSCCSDFLPLSDSEIAEIKRYVKKKHIEPTVRKFYPGVNPTIDLVCPFLDDEKDCDKCKIYAVRPKICRSFKCDTPPSKIRANRDMFWKTRKPHSMRAEFFGESYFNF